MLSNFGLSEPKLAAALFEIQGGLTPFGSKNVGRTGVCQTCSGR